VNCDKCQFLECCVSEEECLVLFPVKLKGERKKSKDKYYKSKKQVQNVYMGKDD
jgi:hypothetical protein